MNMLDIEPYYRNWKIFNQRVLETLEDLNAINEHLINQKSIGQEINWQGTCFSQSLTFLFDREGSLPFSLHEPEYRSADVSDQSEKANLDILDPNYLKLVYEYITSEINPSITIPRTSHDFATSLSSPDCIGALIVQDTHVIAVAPDTKFDFQDGKIIMTESYLALDISQSKPLIEITPEELPGWFSLSGFSKSGVRPVFVFHTYSEDLD